MFAEAGKPCGSVQRQPADGAVGASASVKKFCGGRAAHKSVGAAVEDEGRIAAHTYACCGEAECDDGYTVEIFWQRTKVALQI